MSANPRARFVTLDAMRGAAALLVVLWHIEALLGFRPLSGYLAVDLFFGLSGFVISFSYDSRLKNGLPILEFIRLRLIRLMPLHLAGLAISSAGIALLIMLKGPADWSLGKLTVSAALSAFFLPTPPIIGVGPELFPLNAPVWSLFFELFVNFLLVISFNRLSDRLLALVIASSGIFLIWIALQHGSLNVGFTWENWMAGFPRVLFSFCVGIALKRLYVSGRFRNSVSPWFPLVLSLATLTFGPIPALRPGFDLIAVLLVFPSVLWMGATARDDRAPKAFKVLGDASYGMYVLHVPVMAVLVGGLGVLGISVAAHAPWLGIGFAALVVLGSAVADAIYDAPVRRWLTRVTRPKAAPDRIEPEAR